MGSEYAWHSLSIEEVAGKLDTDLHNGISEGEARTRLQKYGYNELEKPKEISPLKIFLSQFANILILILLAASFLSAAIGEIIDATLIVIIVFFCAVLGFTQEYKAERALEALKKMVSPVATVVRDGKEKTIYSREVVPGDILILKEGDRIVADSLLFDVVSLQVDEAPLTGESVPVSKKLGILPRDTAVADRTNMVFSGTLVTYGKGKAVVVATGMNTEFGKTAKEVGAVVEEEAPLARRMGEIGGVLGKLCLGVCAAIAVIALARQYLSVGAIDLSAILAIVMFAIALAVAALPEALPAIVTGTLAIGMHQMAKRNAMVRKMPAVETLGCTTVICSDKTGTLTKGEMTARRIYADGMTFYVSGTGYEPKGEFRATGTIDLGKEPLPSLFRACILCNDARIEREEGRWCVKGDPTEGALVVLAMKTGFKQDEVRNRYPRIGEIPFSSERKRMSTVHLTPEGRKVVYMKGAPEAVLEKCTHIFKEGMIKDLTEDRRREILRVNEEMAKDALRVLAVAYKEIPADLAKYEEEDVEEDLIFLGLVGMIDPPREEAIEAVKVCHAVKMKPIMITGDHKLTATAIAEEMGIYKEGDLVLTGPELDKMSDEEYEKVVDKVTVYARVDPIQKVRIVDVWKRRGQVVAMTGDGVNDAPALKRADIGIAMGITGTEVTKETSDMVLADDNFATIVKATELGRWIYDNVKKYLTYLLEVNIVEIIVLGMAVILIGDIHMLPLTAPAILYINLVTDGLPAIALGLAPPDPDIMQRPPRDPKEPVFSREVKSLLMAIALVNGPLFLGVYLYSLMTEGLLIARTRLFLIFVISELVIALNCRSLRFTINKAKPHKLLCLAVIWELLLLSVLIGFVPPILEAFGIGYPTFIDIAIVATLALVPFTVIELVKRALH